jgi:hypothetical protein
MKPPGSDEDRERWRRQLDGLGIRPLIGRDLGEGWMAYSVPPALPPRSAAFRQPCRYCNDPSVEVVESATGIRTLAVHLTPDPDMTITCPGSGFIVRSAELPPRGTLYSGRIVGQGIMNRTMGLSPLSGWFVLLLVLFSLYAIGHLLVKIF